MSKVALCMGLNYTGTRNQLNGCINDAKNIQNLLEKHYKYDSVKVMTDETTQKPTYSNIVNELHNLAVRSHSEDIKEIFISYSGHGSYVRDYSGDEKDGRDEGLVPLDYQRRGLLLDDVLNNIFASFSPKVKVVALFDCCHSGSMVDLQFIYDSTTHRQGRETNKKLNSNVLMISGCRDNQTSADAYNFNHQYKYTGAMTSSWLHVLAKHNYNVKCFDLVDEMGAYLKMKRMSQIPQLSCTKRMDKNDNYSDWLSN